MGRCRRHREVIQPAKYLWGKFNGSGYRCGMDVYSEARWRNEGGVCAARCALPPPPFQKEVAVQLHDFHLVDSLPSAGAFWICLSLCAEDTLSSGSSYTAGLLGPRPFCPVPHSCKNDLFLGNSLLDSPRLCWICLGVCHSLGSRPASSPFSCHRCEMCTNLRAHSLPDPVSSPPFIFYRHYCSPP